MRRFFGENVCSHGRVVATAAIFLVLVSCAGCQKTRALMQDAGLNNVVSTLTAADSPGTSEESPEVDPPAQDRFVSISHAATVSQIDAAGSTAEESSPTPFLNSLISLPGGGDVRPRKPVAPDQLNAGDRGVINLTLAEAIALTLERNKFVKVERYSPSVAAQEISIEDSFFHPLFQIGGQYSSTTSQIANLVNGPGLGIAASNTTLLGPPQGFSDQVRISQQTRSGGQVSAGLSSVFTLTDPSGSFLNLNPSYRSSATAEISHPFFRGAGYDIAMTQVRIAQDLTQAARCRLEVTLSKSAFETSSAYWDLVEARSRLDSRHQGVKEATAALNRENEKLQLGASSTPEVAAVREQLERFRVNLSLAEGDVANAERRLRTSLGISREDGSQIIPASQPVAEAPRLDWDQAVDSLRYRRPEIRLQDHLLQSACRRVKKAENGLLPDVQGYAGVSVSGTEESFSQSLQTLSDAEFGSWWAGVTYERQLGRCADRSNHQQALFALAQQRASCVFTKDQALDELHAAHQTAMTAWRGVLMTQAQQAAASEVLQARREMHELGEISVQDYLLSLTQWNQALTDQRAAISSYNSALAAWRFAEGTILTYQDSSPDEVIQAERLSPASSDDP